jgi:hypothetical protein
VTIISQGIKDQPLPIDLYSPHRSSLVANCHGLEDLRGRLPSKKVEFAFVEVVPMLCLDPSCAALDPSSLGFTDYACYFIAGH